MEQPRKKHPSVLNQKCQRLKTIKKIQQLVGSDCNAKFLEQNVYLQSRTNMIAYERLLKREVFKVLNPVKLTIPSQPSPAFVPKFEQPIYGDWCKGMVQCRNCKSRDVKMENRQIRSADEGMTTFFCCRPCGYRWTLN